MDLFIERNQIQLGLDLTADGTAEVDSAVEDAQGFQEITFAVKLGDVDAAAVLTFAVKENSASHLTVPAPTAVALDSVSAGVLTAGNLVVTESSGNLDDKIILITVKGAKLTKRYVFLAITCTVESFEVDCILTIKSGIPSALPVTQPSDVYATAQGAA
jgi:hypothetical protein